MARSDLASFTALVIISGDGLVFETLNALVAAPQQKAVPPIAIVPCGSGNGLLASVFHARSIAVDDSELIQKAVDVVCSPLAMAVPVSLVDIQTPANNFVSFLSVGWGIIADIDIESERYRRLCASNRFVLGAVFRLGNLKSYRGKLSYLEAQSRNGADLQECYKFSYVYETHSSPPATTTAEPPPNNTESVNGITNNSNSGTVALDQDVPASWTTVEDDFVLVYAVYLSHIGSQAHYMPQAQLNEPIIWLSYIARREVTSRYALFHFLNSIRTGTHLESDFCHTIPTTALRLEPEEGKGRIVVDGELMDCTRIQADVSSRTFYVVSL